MFPLSQSKKFCFSCGTLMNPNIWVQSIENLPDIAYPSDNDIKPLNFIILCSLLNPLELRSAEMTP